LFRYLALVWHDDDAAARETARRLIDRHLSYSPGWQVALRKKGLFVGYAGVRVGSSEPYCLAGGGGVVLGKLFERPSNSPSIAAPLNLDDSRSRSILESQGRRLVDSYWGRYVAFLHDDGSGTSWVLRDPSGGLPCVTVRFGGVRLFFSAMKDVQHLGLGPFDVNWGYLAASICMMKGPTHATGLREVSQVLAGECVELRDDHARSTFYWDPLQIANSNIVENPLEATYAMRDCVMDAVRAWASCYSSITLSLSGGLDSSVLYAALRDTPAKSKLTCFHYYPIGPDIDERRFARLVARSGGTELLERPRDSALSLRPLLECEASHEPSNYLYYLENSRLDADIAASHNATAAFTGWGGDQLFYQNHAFLAAGDYLHYRRPDLQFLRIAFDSAQMDRVSVWHVLREAFAERVKQRRWNLRDEMVEYMPLVRREIIEAVYSSGDYVHPLLNDPRDIPSGKLWHAFQVMSPWEFYDPFGLEDDPERVSPLYSQPVLELCLRIPVHILTYGGWDRAIARRAFYDELPREVANRRNKGGIERHVRGIFEHNIGFMRELLLDGALVREGLIDRKKLGLALSGKASKLRPGLAELLDFMGTEAWLRHWRNQGWRAAA
jgi:asparagine synthase (glutamine-hydrolysing)